MYLLLILSVVSFLVSFALTPRIRDWCLHRGLVDRPDQKRKMHARPVPRAGGIPIAIAYLGCFLLSMLPQLGGRFSFGVGLPLALRFAPAVAVIFATGLLDDLRGLTPRQKLAGQFLAAFLAYGAGVHLNRAVGFQFPLWLAFPATLMWLVGCSNAFNLIDGIDGLAAGVGLFATVTTLMAALLNQHYELAIVTVPLIGALLGFFPYNFSPASIFLGDSGSLLIGFLLGAYGVLWSDKSATLLGMTAPLMAVAIPLFDTALAILRRFLRGQPIWAADRGHIHHRLLDRGLSPKRVVMVLYGVCGIGAA